MRKRISLFIILVLTAMGCVFCLGMDRNPKQNSAVNKEEYKDSVEEALFNFEKVYQRRNVQEFMDLLDEDFEVRLEFIDRLQSHFLAVKELEIHFVIDSVLSAGDKINVRLHWFKKTVDNSGVFNKSQGNSQFTFKSYPKGLKLFSIRQDNPFF